MHASYAEKVRFSGGLFQQFGAGNADKTICEAEQKIPSEKWESDGICAHRLGSACALLVPALI